MNIDKWAKWGVVAFVAGCSSKLDVAPGGVGGNGGTGGGSAGVGSSAGVGAFAGTDPGGTGGAAPGGTGGAFPGGTGGTGGAPPGGMGGDAPGGFGATGGTLIEPPPAGQLGQRCFGGGTVTETKGTSSQADVVELGYCYDSKVYCDASGMCSKIPDCPQAHGACAVRAADPGSGAGGSGGSGGYGAGGSPNAGGNGATLETAQQGVTALASDGTDLYWTEYGTRDALGNFNGDGSLKRFDGAGTKVISSTLQGPINLGVTAAYGYVQLDGAPLVGTSMKPVLMRVSLADGREETAQSGNTLRGFTVAGENAYWDSNDSVYVQSVATGATSAPAVFLNQFTYQLQADSTSLYYTPDGTIWSAPLGGGSPHALGLPEYPFVVKDGYLYGIEGVGDGATLDRAPLGGGSWTRIRALGNGGGYVMRAAGGRFFWQVVDGFEYVIRSVPFDGSSPPSDVANVPKPVSGQLNWVVTGTALYWADGTGAIYSRQLSDLP